MIKSQDEARAEEVYASFARQTAQLADVEIRRAKLQAQNAFIERVIGLSEDRAQRLQADLDIARNQQAKVTEYQRQVQSEALALHDEKQKAQSQLHQVQQQVLQLQRQMKQGCPQGSSGRSEWRERQTARFCAGGLLMRLSFNACRASSMPA